MKKILNSAIALAMLMCSAGAVAQTTQKVTAGKASEYGLIYTLPLTAIDIYIEAELTKEQPGEFFNYAKNRLNINDAIKEEKQSAKVLSVTMVPRGVADSSEQWLVQFKAGSPVSMTLTDDNLPLAINADAVVEPAPAVPVARAAELSPLETPEARQAITQEMARSSSMSKKAELAAQQIFALRETRSDILSGQADNPPADGKAMQLVLDNLAKQEAALTAMFAGTRTSSTQVHKVTFLPDTNEVKGRVVARLSAVDGILDAENLAGEPITVDLRILELGELPLTEKGERKTFPKGGVAYCIPGRAEISVNYAGRKIASQEIALAQLGAIFGLNPALFYDKKQPYSVTFSPTTGAVMDLSPKPVNL